MCIAHTKILVIINKCEIFVFLFDQQKSNSITKDFIIIYVYYLTNKVKHGGIANIKYL